MKVKVHKKVKAHPTTKTIADRRSRAELHRMIDALPPQLCGDARSHLKMLLACWKQARNIID